jgi:hypothetical protein
MVKLGSHVFPTLSGMVKTYYNINLGFGVYPNCHKVDLRLVPLGPQSFVKICHVLLRCIRNHCQKLVILAQTLYFPNVNLGSSAYHRLNLGIY